jgi:hypothetical protein
MLLSKVLRLTAFTVFVWYCNSVRAEEITNETALGARLVFTNIEAVQQSLLIRDQRLELTNLKMWFKNEGQSAARLVALGTMPVLTDKILTPAEEENYFDVAASQWSIKLDGEVQPGQTASFASQNGIDDQGWAEFQAKQKYLYSFLAVSYRTENSNSQNEIVTETCVWFQNADIKRVNYCQSGHNQAFLRGK